MALPTDEAYSHLICARNSAEKHLLDPAEREIALAGINTAMVALDQIGSDSGPISQEVPVSSY